MGIQSFITQKTAFGLLLCCLVFNLLAVYATGICGWDDGSITLAYAKTLAEHGRFALTGASETVEGTSSLLLTFIAAAAYKLFHFSFNHFIYFSQYLSFACLCSVMAITYRQLFTLAPNRWYCLFITALMGLMPMFTREAMNGMEMTLLSLLLLLFVICYRVQSRWLLLVIPLLLLTRFEAIYYLCFTFAGLLLFDKKHRKPTVQCLLYTLIIFAAFTAARYAYFGDVLPNTIYAKMNPPYTPVSLLTKIHIKVRGLEEFLTVYSAFAGLLLLAFIIRKQSVLFLSSILFWMVLAFGSFAFITGKNWGYDGRMTLAVMPLFVLLLADALKVKKECSIGFDNAAPRKFNKETLITFVMLVCLGLTLVVNSELFKENIKRIVIRGSYQNRFPAVVNLFVQRHRNGQANVWDSPDYFSKAGLATEALRTLLGLKTITFMGPDIGGVGLCCDEVNVVDMGLLTNHFLAKNGFTKFPALMLQTKPDVVQTYPGWSAQTHIHQLKYFRDNYQLIVFCNKILWLRRDHIAKLMALPRVVMRPIKDRAELAYIEMNGQYDNQYDGVTPGEQNGYFVSLK